MSVEDPLTRPSAPPGRRAATFSMSVLPWLLAGLSGVLGALSMPGPGLGFLSWVALVPLCFALQGQTPRRGLQLGAVAGACFFAFLLYWLYTLWDWAGLLIIPGYLLLVGYLALYWGAFGSFYAWFNRRLPVWAMVLIAPALWTLLEFLRALGPFGFTWGQLAQATYRELPLIQAAALGGIWIISFLILLINYLLYLGLSRHRWRYPALALIVLGLVWGWGAARLGRPLSQEPALRVALIQPNIPQRLRGDRAYLSDFLAQYQKLLARIPVGSTDLVILPESILPTYVLHDRLILGYFERYARERRTALLLGTIDARPTGFYNTAALLSSGGTLLGTYDKVQLVPFSTEYFPGIGLFNRLGFSRWLPIGRLGELKRGAGFRPLEAPWGRLGVDICFESIFPRIGRALVRRGAGLLVTITNDAWFKRSWALPQHLAFGVYRAIETDRYFLQAANTGLSAIVGPRGRIVRRSAVAQAALLRGQVQLRADLTPYVRYGDWFIYLALGLLGVAGLWIMTVGARHAVPLPDKPSRPSTDSSHRQR
ncbi:MAG TPA: apolipoprotein N-acyltransferase [Candidatus Fraserbacteria bacterium]|nr:apolipoprotein N-acyltransferase [Candidatus Fraserbacteria bacterium]